MKIKNILTMTEKEKERMMRMGANLENEYHVSNIYKYLAFCIVCDCESYGVKGSFYNHDGTIVYFSEKLYNQPVLAISEFLEDNGIDTINKVVEHEEEIGEFFINHLKNDWGIKDP